VAVVALVACLAFAATSLSADRATTRSTGSTSDLAAKPVVPLRVQRLLKERAPRAAYAPTRLQKSTPNRVVSLAMDGPRIAYDVARGYPVGRCNGVYVWNVASGATAHMSGASSCGNEGSSSGEGVREVAVAGPRVAWIVNEGGNTYHKDYLYTAALPRPKEHLLASAYREGEGEEGLTCGQPHPRSSGKWVGCLVGAQTALVVNRWSTGRSGDVTSARLESIGNRLRKITADRGSMDAVSTDGKRVAVVRRDGTVALSRQAQGLSTSAEGWRRTQHLCTAAMRRTPCTSSASRAARTRSSRDTHTSGRRSATFSWSQRGWHTTSASAARATEARSCSCR